MVIAWRDYLSCTKRNPASPALCVFRPLVGTPTEPNGERKDTGSGRKWRRETLDGRYEMASFIVIVTGIAGGERFLGDGKEVEAAQRARRFRSDVAAKEAAKAHIGQYAPVVQRTMRYRVVARFA